VTSDDDLLVLSLLGEREAEVHIEISFVADEIRQIFRNVDDMNGHA
jgi:hypothetical protein